MDIVLNYSLMVVMAGEKWNGIVRRWDLLRERTAEKSSRMSRKKREDDSNVEREKEVNFLFISW